MRYWTPDRTDMLKRLWGEGLTASEIAAQLGDGISRNAVIGKADRLNLAGRVKPVVARPPRPRNPKPGQYGGLAKKIAEGRLRKAQAPKPKPPPKPDPTETASLNLSLMELREDTCRWPHGNPRDEDFAFCGHEVEPGEVYCPFHCWRAYPSGKRAKPQELEEAA
jgi:GcrA cell cycle regulator